MFLFSKKFLLLMVAVALLFGGERRLAKALKCHKCHGPYGWCDADHFGTSIDCDDTGACAVFKNETTTIISKYCESDHVVWENGTNDYKPKCSKSACYCLTDNCNKPKNFGMPGGSENTGGGGSTVGDSLTNGAIGYSSIISLVWMMAVGPSVVIEM